MRGASPYLQNEDGDIWAGVDETNDPGIFIANSFIAWFELTSGIQGVTKRSSIRNAKNLGEGQIGAIGTWQRLVSDGSIKYI